MKRKITIINSTNRAIELQTVPVIVIKQGTDDYLLKQALVDQVVRQTSSMQGVTVQLEQGAKPSTVDGKANSKQFQDEITALNKELDASKAELKSSETALESALKENEALTKKVAELESMLSEVRHAESQDAEIKDESQEENTPTSEEVKEPKKPATPRKNKTQQSKE